MGKKERIKEVRQLLTLLLGSVLLAVSVAGALVYYYSPTGRYTTDQVMLNPTVAEKLEQVDNRSGLVFEGVDYSVYVDKEIGWKQISLSHDQYQQFYGLITGSKSLWEVPEILPNRFATGKPASLIVRVKEKNRSRVFQEVQILPDGYYRIEIRQIDAPNRWAYFYQDGLYQKSVQIFLEHR